MTEGKPFQMTMNYGEFLIFFFPKTVDELKNPNILNYKFGKTNDPLKEAFEYFENHPSITYTKSKSFDVNFTLKDSSSEVIKLIKTLNVKKAS